MASPRAFSLAVLCSSVVVTACGGDAREAAVRWELSIASVSGEAFGVRVFLDGRTVFEQQAPTASQHVATVSGTYTLQEHVVEYEILSPRRDPATYVGVVEYEIPSDGRAAIVDGVPTELRAGQRLRIAVFLAPSPGL